MWRIGYKWQCKVPKGARFTLDELLELRTRFISERHLHHPGHKDHEWICKEQHSYLVGIVSEFIDAHTSNEDADLMRRAKASNIIRNYQIAILVLFPISMLSVIAVQHNRLLTVVTTTLWIALFVALWLVASEAPWFLRALVFVWLYIRYTPVQAVTEMLARFLDNANPGHTLRWVAFIMILLGFHLDLLSS
jgi:hypothetical protein